MQKKLLSIPDIIKTGWELYIENFQKFLIPIVIVISPYIIFYLLQYLEGAAISILFLITFVLIIMIELWMTIFFIETINYIYNQQTFDLNKIYENAFKKISSYFWVSILTALIVTVGIIVFLIPGLIFAVWFSFSSYINVLEGQKGSKAIAASKELVRGRWGATFWRLIIPPLFIYAISMMIIFALTYMFTGGNINSESIEQSILVNALFTLIFSILTPLLVSFNVIIYNNLKKTKSNLEDQTLPL